MQIRNDLWPQWKKNFEFKCVFEYTYKSQLHCICDRSIGTYLMIRNLLQRPARFVTDMRFLVLGLTLIVSLLVVKRVSAHGRLIEPPSRASMWRYGFDTPQDYNDHECYCGGFTRQWQRNKGKCGICGDPWDSSTVSLPEKKNVVRES